LKDLVVASVLEKMSRGVRVMAEENVVCGKDAKQRLKVGLPFASATEGGKDANSAAVTRLLRVKPNIV